jgi:hypothetical protein
MADDRTDDRELTLELARVLDVATTPAALAPLFDSAPELVEWSLNAAGDARGTLRASVWTRDRDRAARTLAALAPEHVAIREQLAIGDEFEGIGLALRPGAAPAVRWWQLADDGAALAESALRAWPQHAAELTALLADAGGAHACTAVGAELPGRETLYVRLADPEVAVRVLARARVPVSRAANLFWKGICGLEPGGRPWPQVWAGRSFGPAGGWKFYYFARGDELRRTDEVLLAAAGASDATRAAWTRVRDATGGPCLQLLGLVIRDAHPAGFTVYLARF